LTGDHTLGQGFPLIKNYDITEFEAFQQSWDVVQDTNGIIYIAHGSGILQFDGVNWWTTHGENSNHILDLELADNGTIYYGGEDEFGYLARDSLNRFQLIDLKSEFFGSEELVGDIWNVHSNNQEIYFQSLDGVFKWEKGELNKIVKDIQIQNSFLIDNQLYIKSPNSSLKSLNNDLENIEELSLFAEESFFFADTIGENLLIGMNESGFLIVGPHQVVNVSENINSEIVQGSPFRSKFISNKRLGVTNYELGYFEVDLEKNTIKNFKKVTNNKNINQLSDNVALGIYVDNNKDIWVSTINGLSQIVDHIPITIYEADSFFEGVSTSIQFFKGELFLGGQQGLFVKKNCTTDSVCFEQIMDSYVNHLTIHKNVLIIATRNGLFAYDNNDLDQILEGRIDAISSDNENLWIVQNSELKKITNSSGSLDIFETGLTGSISNAVYSEGILWIHDEALGVRGFNTIENAELILDGGNIKSNDLSYIGILFNKVKFGTEKGLYAYNKMSNIIEPDTSFRIKEFNDNQVFRFNSISEDSIWFHANKKSQLIVKSGEEWEQIDQPFMFLDQRYSPTSLESNGSKTWLLSNYRLIEFSSTNWDYHTDFKTNITGIYVNNDSLIYGGFGEPVNPIVLPYEDNELRFTYAAASYIDETRNTYSVKLEGFDESWSDWSLETQKDYTNIPEGDYVFKVRSKNVFEVDGREDQILFSVLPPWYRTWWAYFLYLIGFSGLVYSAHKIRLNQLLKVERMRTKIASDLHDEVSATLTGISYFAEAVKTDENEEKKNHFINLITESAGDAKEKITDIVWSITPENDDWSLFLTKCRRYASDLLESSGMEYTLNITDFIPGKLRMNTRQHLWMIFKEILTNAVRHSGGKRIDLILDVEDGVLKLIVQDDGNGFDISSKSFGNGVKNIRKRANVIRASLELDSETEMGTRWRLELKL